MMIEIKNQRRSRRQNHKRLPGTGCVSLLSLPPRHWSYQTIEIENERMEKVESRRDWRKNTRTKVVFCGSRSCFVEIESSSIPWILKPGPFTIGGPKLLLNFLYGKVGAASPQLYLVWIFGVLLVSWNPFNYVHHMSTSSHCSV